MRSEHDIRYKYLFSHPLFVQRLLQSFVHERFVRRLDFNSLQRIDKSFVTEEFRERESDIIWKIDFQGSALYLFLLLEFQSTVDHTMPLRFLRYITEFYQSFHGKTESSKLPPVFPLLLYNGDRSWTVPGNIAELIETTIPEKYIPSFHYYPVIENEIPKSTLVRVKNALSAVFYAENSSPEELEREIDTFFSIIKEEELEAVQILANWLNDFLATRDSEKRKPVMQKINSLMEVKSMFLTKLKEHDERIREEGKKQGIVKGIEENRRQTVRKMLSKGYPVEEICEITGLSREEVERLKE
ncbi:MAG: hypothetical protein DRP87_19295 [Spirochaetes bacterium]|nr:MAG: hypothetical protein DRP87_19295 [Spirochaetota bacterium]